MTFKITESRLKELLTYQPLTGQFVWNMRRGRARAGDVAGNLDNGYVQIRIDGRRYMGHVLAWLYMTGCTPTVEVDHKDLDRANNRWDNLRLGTHAENNQNKPKPKNNTSGVKGARRYKRTNRFVAAIMAHGQARHLGYFDTLEEASAAYVKAAKELHGEFARLV
jgi:hypothetical protein